MEINPSSDKLHSAIRQCNILARAATVSNFEWQRIIGKLVWMAVLNRPLLACMQRVFAGGAEERQQTVQIKDAWEKELQTLFQLLPLAAVRINMEISPMVVAFDASLKAGAVKKTFVGHKTARTLWDHTQAARCSNTIPPKDKLSIVKLIANTYSWKKVMSRNCTKQEHINGLEASAAVLALESAIRAGVHNQRIVMFTDSLAVIGALEKGQSLSPIIIVRFRRFMALALAHNVKST